MIVTVYSKPDCVQCKYTKQILDKQDAKYQEIDVTIDKNAAKFVEEVAENMGIKPALPLVTVENNKHEEYWFGFKLDKLRGLKDYN